MGIRWHCRKCNNTWDFIHKDGEKMQFDEVMRLAQEDATTGVYMVTFYCPQCDTIMGVAQFPAGALSPMVVEGDVNIFYTFEPLKEEEASVVREIELKVDSEK